MRHTLTNSLLATAALSLLALAGCDAVDPLKRPYMWEESGVNAHNIAAMAANPADLVHGQDSPRHRADPDSVDRVWTNKPTQLLGGGSAAPAGGGS